MQYALFNETYRLREKLSPKARNIRLEVRPGGEVVLVYPRWVPRVEALAFLKAREDWIRDKLQELERREQANPPLPPARWDGSDLIPLRGVDTVVEIVPATLRQPSLRLEPGRLTLFCPPALRADTARLEQVLRRELQQQARADARRYLDAEAARLGVRYAALRINDPQTLWGSCNPTGTICLSWRLVLAPPEVFHYVAVHELCHLVHRNHSERFWALVAQQLPDYEMHKRWLREHGNRLHRILASREAENA